MRLVPFVAGLIAGLSLLGAAFAHDRGPSIGAAIPSIATVDEGNRPQSFASLKGERGLVLAFTRSADWCPYCQAQIIELNARRAEFESRGYKIAVITTDAPDKLARFDARRDIGFPLLSDPAFRLVDAFDLRDPAFPPGQRGHGLPVPTVFVVNASGVIIARMGDADYKVRPTARTVLDAIDAQR